MQHVILALEQELEATQQRCHQIERALAALREIAGEPAGLKVRTPTRGQGKGKPAAPPPATGAGKLPSPDEAAERVLAALRKQSPQKPQALTKAAGLTPFTMRRAVRSLLKQRKIETRGKTNSRAIGLPGKMSGKEGL